MSKKIEKSLEDWKRLCRALSLCQNRSSSSNDKVCKKKEEIGMSKKIEKSLEDWKLPPSASDVLKRSSIFNFSGDRTVKTVEKEIPLSEEYLSFPLFTDNLRRVYNGEALDLYIGVIEVGLKPTKLGSNATAIVCLRDKRRLTFHDSLLGMVESSLSDGPIYFSYVPSHRLDLCDPCLSSAVTLDIKIQGSSMMPLPTLILMYRFHYKLMTTLSNGKKEKLSRSPVDVKGETTLFITNVGRRNGVVPRKIYWDQLSVPEPWMHENNSTHSASSFAAAAEQGAVSRANWIETAEAYVLQIDVTGYKEGDVNVDVRSDRTLKISGQRRSVVSSSSRGKFVRCFELPENANLDEVKAAVENEVLTITVAKGGDKSSRSILAITAEGLNMISMFDVYVRW